MELQRRFYASTSSENSRHSLRCIGQASAALHSFMHVPCIRMCTAVRTKRSRVRSYCSRASISSGTRTDLSVAAVQHAPARNAGIPRPLPGIPKHQGFTHGSTGCRQRRSALTFRQTSCHSFGSLLHPIRPCCSLHAAMNVQASSRTQGLIASVRPSHDLSRRQPDRSLSDYQTRHGWLTRSLLFPYLPSHTATGRPVISRKCGGMLDTARLSQLHFSLRCDWSCR